MNTLTIICDYSNAAETINELITRATNEAWRAYSKRISLTKEGGKIPLELTGLDSYLSSSLSESGIATVHMNQPIITQADVSKEANYTLTFLNGTLGPQNREAYVLIMMQQNDGYSIDTLERALSGMKPYTRHTMQQGPNPSLFPNLEVPEWYVCTTFGGMSSSVQLMMNKTGPGKSEAVQRMYVPRGEEAKVQTFLAGVRALREFRPTKYINRDAHREEVKNSETHNPTPRNVSLFESIFGFYLEGTSSFRY